MTCKNDIEILMQDAEFMNKIENVQSAEELTAILQERGYEVNPENAQLAIDYKNGECELPEELLDEVAGGHPAAAALLIGGGVLLLIVGTATVLAIAREVSSWKKKKK